MIEWFLVAIFSLLNPVSLFTSLIAIFSLLLPALSSLGRSGCKPTRGTWHKTRSDPPFYNLSCPLEWSKYSCAYQEKPYSDAVAHFQFHSDCGGGWLTPAEMVRRARGRPVFFIGDSLARQQFISLACSTWEFVSDTDVAWARRWPCHAQPRCVGGGEHSGFERGCFTWSVGGGGSRSQVCYSIQRLEAVLKLTKPAVVVVSLESAHIDVDVYEHHVELIHNTLSSYLTSDSGNFSLIHQIFYREASPQHFPTRDGGFEALLTKRNCTKQLPENSDSQRKANLEQKYLLPLEANRNFRFIPTIAHLASRGDWHVGDGVGTAGDCTHWCMPGPVHSLEPNALFYAPTLKLNAGADRGPHARSAGSVVFFCV